MRANLKKKDFYNVPNILTYLRLLCVPAFIAVFFAVDPSRNLNVYISLIIFSFASLTDLADGYIARKFNVVSDLGKMLDPLADKLLQVSAVVCLCINDFISVSELGKLFIVFPILLGAKELFMLGWGIKLANKNIIVHSNIFGKIAAFSNAIGILLSFFCGSKYNAIRISATVVLALGCAFAYIALVDYAKKLYHQLDGSLKDKKDINLDF